MQRSLALWAGSDLDEPGQVSAQRHLASCPHCREQWQRLRSGHAALQALRAAPIEPALTATIWPRVERHLQSGESSETIEWHAWLPTGALVAACVAIAVISLPVLGPLGTGDGQAMSVSPVIFSRVVAPPVGERIEQPRPDSPEWSALEDLRRAVPVRTLLNGKNVRDL